MLSADVEIAAAVQNGYFLVSGYWPNWQASGAAGQPVVITWASGLQFVPLIGLDPIFQANFLMIETKTVFVSNETCIDRFRE